MCENKNETNLGQGAFFVLYFVSVCCVSVGVCPGCVCARLFRIVDTFCGSLGTDRDQRKLERKPKIHLKLSY